MRGAGAKEPRAASEHTPTAEPAASLQKGGGPPAAVAGSTHDLTPLEYILRVMRDPAVDAERRDEMAKLALPYSHPKPGPASDPRQTEEPEMSLLEVGRRIAFALDAVSRADHES